MTSNLVITARRQLDTITQAAAQAEYERGRRDERADILKRVTDDAGKCDCSAWNEGECACGAWCDWKTVPMLRVVEIINGTAE